MNFSDARDESLVAFYESLRRQVRADAEAGGRYRFVGQSTRQYADTLCEEMERRQIKFVPIDWRR